MASELSREQRDGIRADATRILNDDPSRSAHGLAKELAAKYGVKLEAARNQVRYAKGTKGNGGTRRVNWIRLMEFAATDEQRTMLAMINEMGMQAAAQKLGIARDTLRVKVGRVKRIAALQGYSPEHDLTKPVDPAHFMHGSSTLYKFTDDPSGKILQWVKTSVKKDEVVQLMREIIEELSSEIKPQEPIKRRNEPTIDDLLNLHVLTDAHFGMRAWSEETGGEDWDLKIAEQVVIDVFQRSLDASPKASTGMLLQLGDAMHYDGMIPETPKSRHVLDTDSRVQLIIRTVIRAFRRMVNMMLEKYDKVIVCHMRGNHDPASCAHFQEWSYVLYENEPRVEIVVDPNPYYAYRHHNVMIGAHHGDKRPKLKDLSELFKEKFRTMFGETKRTYIHAGHYHSDDQYCYGNTKAERHETLAPPDAHASSGGWLSGRSMKCITYHANGEHTRVVLYPEGEE